MTQRAFDVAASAVGLILLSPLLLLIAAAVRLTSRGPILYRAARIGQHARPFKLYKFRTMVANADRLGPGLTLAGDARITKVGRALRRTKLDELPQLWNVLKGDMSLVGPRPEDPRYVAHYTPAQRAILNVRPGITGPASLAYRDENALLAGPAWEDEYVGRIMPAKIVLELDYLAKRTLWRDIAIILRTIFGAE
jgi:lipopolysaccharide/colanic/teichoic acid biosynthesis glycosyltransferase